MGILDWLSLGKHVPEDTDLTAGTSLLIQEVEPRLLAVPNAARRLMRSVNTALDYCRDALAMIPGTFDAAPDSWRKTPELAALFVNNDEVQQIFSRQEDIQDFAETSLVYPRFFALLWVKLEEKQTFSLREEGSLRHEETIINLNFSQHRLILPRNSEEEMEHDLFWGLFRQITREIKNLLDTRHSEREARQREKAMLRARLAYPNLERPETESLTRKLRELIAQDTQPTLEETLEWIAKVLSEPMNLLYINTLESGVDRLNRILPPGAEGTRIRLCRCRVAVPAPREGILLRVSYPIGELLPRNKMRQRFNALFS